MKKEREIQGKKQLKARRKFASASSASSLQESPHNQSFTRLFKVQSQAREDPGNDAGVRVFTPPAIDLNDAEAMRSFILDKAHELVELGAIALPTVGWDGKAAGEQEALDRISFIFAAYKVKYYYVRTEQKSAFAARSWHACLICGAPLCVCVCVCVCLCVCVCVCVCVEFDGMLCLCVLGSTSCWR